MRAAPTAAQRSWCTAAVSGQTPTSAAAATVLGQGRLRLVGDSSGDAFGTALAPAGDLDQDGADELLIGAPGYVAGGGLWTLSLAPGFGG